jgi:cellulose synthase/poly-beta-1,6-N-acetylglucosamine synthase-like glycosyltransferase
MKFSLVTTCFNEMRSLPRWREDLRAQTRQPDEVVIVDAVSQDGTQEFLQDWAKSDDRLRIKIQKCGAARGRNLAIEMSANDHVVSTDLGTRLDPHWFEEIVRPFEEDPTVEIVVGSFAIDLTTLQGIVARAELYLEDGGVAKLGPGFVPGNRSIAYIKKVWRELGGLPEDLTLYADDSVFGRQMLQGNYKTAYASKALVYWRRPSKFKAFWKEQYNYGRGDGEAHIKLPVAYRWYAKGLIPAWMVPPVTALRTMTKRFCWGAISRALGKGDLLACLCMPLLLWGNGYNAGKGFLVGMEHGRTHCQACRARLKNYEGP